MYSFNNLSVKNFFKKGAWRPYPTDRINNFVVRLQTNGSYYTSFMGSFTEPWLGGKKPNSLTIAAFYSNQTNSYSFGGVFYKSDSHFRTTGVSADWDAACRCPTPISPLYRVSVIRVTT